MSTSSQAQALIDFFDPDKGGADPLGRTLTEMLAWSDGKLENRHDYIQNLFPLPEGSMFNAEIWLITPESYQAFRQRPELQTSLAEAARRIFTFYGLEISQLPSGKLALVQGPDFAKASRRWLSSFNHNHLRITRIIRSLRALGAYQYSEAFYKFLAEDMDVARAVSQTSLMYWTRAATRPLRLPPDEDDDAAKGISWLADLER